MVLLVLLTEKAKVDLLRISWVQRSVMSVGLYLSALFCGATILGQALSMSWLSTAKAYHLPA